MHAARYQCRAGPPGTGLIFIDRLHITYMSTHIQARSAQEQERHGISGSER
jgi:hypothetical protein